MVSPLQAWSLVIIACSITFLLWIISAPIVSAFYTVTNGKISDEAQGAANTMRIEFIIFPIAICIGLAVWAALVTTRRQIVTTPGAYY